MYVVIVENKNKEPLSDLIQELHKAFPGEIFTIEGSEDTKYKLRIEGSGDEKLPRAFAFQYLKRWKSKPVIIEGDAK